MKITIEQLGRLLFKSRHEPRRNQKRFLKDLGGDGSAEELDEVLARAKKSPAAVAEAEQLELQRHHMAKTIELGIDGRVAEMLADVRLKMQAAGLTQAEVAERCGWPQSLVAAYLTGGKEPGAKNLAKMASAVGCVWRLVPGQPLVAEEKSQA